MTVPQVSVAILLSQCNEYIQEEYLLRDYAIAVDDAEDRSRSVRGVERGFGLWV
jgi:hypothetical protein